MSGSDTRQNDSLAGRYLSRELVDRAFVALDDPDQRPRLGHDRLVHVVRVRVSWLGRHASSSPDNRTCSSALGYRYVSRLRRDALQPHADCREVLKIEAPSSATWV